jgi:hypothetical protein
MRHYAYATYVLLVFLLLNHWRPRHFTTTRRICMTAHLKSVDRVATPTDVNAWPYGTRIFPLQRNFLPLLYLFNPEHQLLNTPEALYELFVALWTSKAKLKYLPMKLKRKTSNMFCEGNVRFFIAWVTIRKHLSIALLNLFGQKIKIITCLIN